MTIKAAENPIITKSNERIFDIDIKTSVTHWGSGISETNLFIGLLTSNSYQKCTYSNIDDIGSKVVFGYAGDSCIHYTLKMGHSAKSGKRIDLFNSYRITVYDIETDFESIGEIYPYDLKKFNNIKYTKSKKPFIDTGNEELNRVADSIWSKSENVLGYAKKCYFYVGENFKYLNPLTGFHPLEEVLSKKGSDCGNLSSVFITLLRIKKIPARHLMGFRSNGSLHVWADFYLENYGWIPVDVTYKIAYPTEDYFGNIKFKCNGFIVHRGISNIVIYSDMVRRIPGLQTYSYDVLYSDKKLAKVYIEREIQCTELNSGLNTHSTTVKAG